MAIAKVPETKPFNSREYLEGLRRPCKTPRCKRAMHIANVDKAVAGEQWPFYRCNGPHIKPFLEYGEAL